MLGEALPGGKSKGKEKGNGKDTPIWSLLLSLRKAIRRAKALRNSDAASMRDKLVGRTRDIEAQIARAEGTAAAEMKNDFDTRKAECNEALKTFEKIVKTGIG